MQKVEYIDSNGIRKSYYICYDNRKLEFIRVETRTINELTRNYKVYACKDCSVC